jgi:two-component system alkaline phosphatase synthesis response regulator PhoP
MKSREGEQIMIYFVEDDLSIRELVIYTLNSTGLEAVGFEKPSDFWRAMDNVLPSLVLLDIMLPEEDGLEILKKLRSAAATKKLPVIMLTAKGSEYDKVLGLDSGADDYVPKPFGMIELLARIKALLRRTEESDTAREYTLGSLHVSPSRHIVKVDGQTVSLTLKEFEMLCLLLDNHDIVLTRDQILNRVWGYSFDGESRTVDVHIRTLRQKLGHAGDYIETVRGIGYKIGTTGL